MTSKFSAARVTNAPAPPHNGNIITAHRIERFRKLVY
jgi:hypothetical protein